MIEGKYNRLTNLIRDLSLSFAPSGFENEAADKIISFAEKYADDVFRADNGSVIAKIASRSQRKEKKNPVVLISHMDEECFMVKEIDDDGYIKISPLTLKNPKVLAAKNVTLGSNLRRVNGYFGIKPVHLGGAVGFDSLYIDIGSKNKAESDSLVQPGDYAVFRSDFVKFGNKNDYFKGKALSRSAGCSVLCNVMQTLTDNDELSFDVYFIFASRYELNCSSAMPALRIIEKKYGIIPDHAVIVSGINSETVGELFIPSMYGGSLFDRNLNEKLNTCSAAKTSLIFAEKQNEAAADHGILGSGSGIKCSALCIPVKYMHTPANVILRKDVTNAIDLILNLLLRIL